MKMPWMQFHTRDWLDNKELRRCSPLARAILADLMCLAHEGEPYGYLCDKFGALTDEFVAARCFVDVVDFRRAVIELVRFERVSELEGKYYIKRMVEDHEVREKRAKGGALGGNPKLKVIPDPESKVNLTPNLSAQEEGYLPSDSDSDSDSKPASQDLKPDKTENPSPRTRQILSVGRFSDWWELWSAVRGTANKQEALQSWLSVVTPDLEEQCFKCTESYLESLDKPNKGFNPENFLFQQSKAKFEARWPKARDSPGGTHESHTDRAIRKGHELMREFGRL